MRLSRRSVSSLAGLVAGVVLAALTGVLATVGAQPIHAQEPSPRAAAGSTRVLSVSPDASARHDAPSYFRDCASRTGHNATLILPDTLSVVLNGDALDSADVEIAVFTPGGRCAGQVRWTSQSATALTAWGAAAPVPAGQAFNPGDSLAVRVWRPDARVEYSPDRVRLVFADHAPYLRTRPIYAPNAIYVVDTVVLRGK